jgi:hypothetical protein
MLEPKGGKRPASAPESQTPQDMSLCYNAAIMKYPFRFTNDNANDNDDLQIVGRSLAG